MLERPIISLKQIQTMLQDIISVLKAVDCTAKAPLQERLVVAESLYGKNNIYVLYEALNIARGTFYNHLFRSKRGKSMNAKKREEVRVQMQNVFDENGRVFGAKKIQAI